MFFHFSKHVLSDIRYRKTCAYITFIRKGNLPKFLRVLAPARQGARRKMTLGKGKEGEEEEDDKEDEDVDDDQEDEGVQDDQDDEEDSKEYICGRCESEMGHFIGEDLRDLETCDTCGKAFCDSCKSCIKRSRFDSDPPTRFRTLLLLPDFGPSYPISTRTLK